MPDSGRKRPFRAALADAVRTVVFFGLMYVYLLVFVKPHLIYDCAVITNFPAFYTGWAFFVDSVSQPGGLLKYLSAFSSHLFYDPWIAALVVTMQAWLLSACSGLLFRAVALPGARVLRFVPALLVLAAYRRYTYHLPMITGALASLVFTLVYLTVVSRGQAEAPNVSAVRRWTPPLHVAIFAVLAVVSYVVSAGAYFLFVGLSLLYELLFRRRYIDVFVYGIVAAVLPYAVGVLVLHANRLDAYTDILPISWQVRSWPGREEMVAAVHGLYLVPVAAVLTGWLWQMVGTWLRRRRQAEASDAKPANSSATRMREWRWGPPARWVLATCLLFLAAGAVGFLWYDVRRKALLEVHHYACRRMWPEVLAAARLCPNNDFTISAVDRALYHTGRLGRDLCTYVQRPEALLLVGRDQVLRHWHKFDVLIDLGLINLAEKNLTECMAVFGEHPMILKRLALVNMVKGGNENARIYLGALSRTLFHGGWAREYLARLDRDPDLAGDSQIQHLRARSLQAGHIALFYAKQPMLSALVEQGQQNRMAFEYLMTWYLLSKKLDKVVENAERLVEFGYTEIPPLWQEALLIYAYGTQKPVPLGGLTISPKARQRIERFSRVFNRYKRNKEAAFPELAKEYRGSYFFYYVYAP